MSTYPYGPDEQYPRYGAHVDYRKRLNTRPAFVATSSSRICKTTLSSQRDRSLHAFCSITQLGHEGKLTLEISSNSTAVYVGPVWPGKIG